MQFDWHCYVYDWQVSIHLGNWSHVLNYVNKAENTSELAEVRMQDIYIYLVYTKTVDSVEGAHWLVRQTCNILCYLPPSNSRENGVPVCIRDNWRNDPN